MFCKISLWSHPVQCFCILEFLITASILLRVIGLFGSIQACCFLIQFCMCLEICTFCPDCPISWHIVFHSNFLNPLCFSVIGCNFSSFISDFIYLVPLSFFLELVKGLSILFIFSKNDFLDLLILWIGGVFLGFFLSICHLILLWLWFFPSI